MSASYRCQRCGGKHSSDTTASLCSPPMVEVSVVEQTASLSPAAGDTYLALEVQMPGEKAMLLRVPSHCYPRDAEGWDDNFKARAILAEIARRVNRRGDG